MNSGRNSCRSLMLLPLFLWSAGCEAASYQAINTKFSIEQGTTVFSPTQHAKATAQYQRQPGKVDFSIDCTALYPTCTACAEDPACAWCKNLNRCVTERLSGLTCIDQAKEGTAQGKNSNLGGVFGPEASFDHVGQVCERC